MNIQSVKRCGITAVEVSVIIAVLAVFIIALWSHYYGQPQQIRVIEQQEQEGEIRFSVQWSGNPPPSRPTVQKLLENHVAQWKVEHPEYQIARELKIKFFGGKETQEIILLVAPSEQKTGKGTP